MSGYIGTQPVPQATQHRETFTATASQTTFATVGYTPQFVDVYLNGIHLLDTVDYTATNSSDVVLTTGAAASDVVEIISYTPFEVANQTFTGTTTVDVLTATGAFTSLGIDDNATTTAMTLDASGNLLVGTGISPSIASIKQVLAGSNGRYTQWSNTTPSGGGYVGSNGTSLEFGMHTGAVGSEVYSEKMRLDVNGNLLVGGTTSPSGSGQIVATGGVYLGGTGAANKLDDYEEGTWTPTLEGHSSSGVGTYGQQDGSYVKVGRLVHYQMYLTWTAHTGVGNMLFAGLPFTTSALSKGYATSNIGYMNNLTWGGTNAVPFAHTALSSTFAYLGYSTDGSGYTNSPMDTAGDIILSGTYYTDS